MLDLLAVQAVDVSRQPCSDPRRHHVPLWHEAVVSRVQEFVGNRMESGHATDIVTPPPLTPKRKVGRVNASSSAARPYQPIRE